MARPNIAVEQDDPRVVRLLGLLLVDVLETVARGRTANGARESREWICAGDSGAVYSFENACTAFNLPPQALRRRVGLRAQVPRRRSARGWTRGPGR
ncbi:MAG TPA: hypothetical protein VKA21_17010 [Candidatus Binatia bacterium]|nr:hypothetical protein [Candidatus Binatia bacterium]